MCIHQCLMAIKSCVQQFILGRYMVSLQQLRDFTCRECFELFFLIRKEWTCCIWRTKSVKVKVSKKLWRSCISSQTVLQIMFYLRLFEKNIIAFKFLFHIWSLSWIKSRTNIEEKNTPCLLQLCIFTMIYFCGVLAKKITHIFNKDILFFIKLARTCTRFVQIFSKVLS